MNHQNKTICLIIQILRLGKEILIKNAICKLRLNGNKLKEIRLDVYQFNPKFRIRVSTLRGKTVLA